MFSFSFTALVAPVIKDFNNVTVSQDKLRNITITCDVTGNPEPMVTWQRNGKPLNDLPKIDTLNECKTLRDNIYQKKGGMRNVLIICGLNFEEHEGKFTCTAKNVLNTITKSMDLVVYGMLKCSLVSSKDMPMPAKILFFRYAISRIKKMHKVAKCSLCLYGLHYFDINYSNDENLLTSIVHFSYNK